MSEFYDIKKTHEYDGTQTFVVAERGAGRKAARLACDIIDCDGHVIGRAFALTPEQNEKFVHMAVNTVSTLEDYPFDMQKEFLFFDLDDLED